MGDEAGNDPSQSSQYKKWKMDGKRKKIVNEHLESSQLKNYHDGCCDCCILKLSDDSSFSSSMESGHCYKSVPFGYRFKPTNEEIVSYYLPMKMVNLRMQYNPINVVDMYAEDPFELLDRYREYAVDGKEWYFFTKREKRHKKGGVAKRDIPGHGCWKSIGHNKRIPDNKNIPQIGFIQKLEFYRAGQISGTFARTDLKMDEYIVGTKSGYKKKHQPEDGKKPVFQEWVVCKLYCSSRTKTEEEANPIQGTAEEEANPVQGTAEEDANSVQGTAEEETNPLPSIAVVPEAAGKAFDLNDEYVPEENEGPAI